MVRDGKWLPGVRDQVVREYELRHKAVARQIAEEGIVLLKNEGILPLKEGKTISLYGSGARHTIKGGTGSGDVNERESITIEMGLRAAGLGIDTADWLDRYDEVRRRAVLEWKEDILGRVDEAHPFINVYFSRPYRNPEENEIEEESLGNTSDVAIYVLSRISGEGSDRRCERGDFLLSQSEEHNLNCLCRGGKQIILVLNTGGMIDLTFTERMPQIKAIVYLIQAGMEGGHALADVLTGAVSPSGKLTDTWGTSYEMWPSYDTFGANNGDLETEYYTEGIFVGYRWFDAFQKQVRYPFGFGLSYTRFQINVQRVHINGGKGILQVEVRNDGRYAGKEVVQVYAVCANVRQLSREEKKLIAFQKTGLLAPGAHEVLRVEFSLDTLGRFDEKEQMWVIDAEDYGIYVGNHGESLREVAVLSLEEDIELERTRAVLPVQKDLKEVSHIPPVRSFSQETPVLKLGKPAFAREQQGCDEREAQETLEHIRHMTKEQLVALVCGKTGSSESAAGASSESIPGAAGETVAWFDGTAEIPSMVLADGPAGLRLSQHYQTDAAGHIYPQDIESALEHGLFAQENAVDAGAVDYYQYCTAFPIGTMVAQTWNLGLAEEMGRAVAEEMEMFGVSLWLAPGMNIHRNPLCGRNFEYYAEDPLLSGKMASAVTRGVQSVPGCGTTIKHCACNSQEDNRMGVDCVVSQRALREIYLKGFEIAVQESNPRAIMMAYNQINGIYASNAADLCTGVIRGEWGFQGILMTDWTTTDNGAESAMCIKAGTDLIMPGTLRDHERIKEALETGKLTETELRTCAGRIAEICLQSVRAERMV